ncbi:unnamed protein product [Nezara viridula]|uniref:Uncharacterized protein n=1 Tax=Nezara viridula TaxID=85310 RepID=A0A9P0E976_NEZVI|nr:unnamed protein product [Nezara viridula]
MKTRRGRQKRKKVKRRNCLEAAVGRDDPP